MFGERWCRSGPGTLTYVVFVIDDRVERHVFPIQVSLGRLHVIGAVVALDEAFKLTVHDGAVTQGSLLAWKQVTVERVSQEKTIACLCRGIRVQTVPYSSPV